MWSCMWISTQCQHYTLWHCFSLQPQPRHEQIMPPTPTNTTIDDRQQWTTPMPLTKQLSQVPTAVPGRPWTTIHVGLTPPLTSAHQLTTTTSIHQHPSMNADRRPPALDEHQWSPTTTINKHPCPRTMVATMTHECSLINKQLSGWECTMDDNYDNGNGQRQWPWTRTTDNNHDKYTLSTHHNKWWREYSTLSPSHCTALPPPPSSLPPPSLPVSHLPGSLASSLSPSSLPPSFSSSPPPLISPFPLPDSYPSSLNLSLPPPSTFPSSLPHLLPPPPLFFPSPILTLSPPLFSPPLPSLPLPSPFPHSSSFNIACI